jgi:hypothetical protein
MAARWRDREERQEVGGPRVNAAWREGGGEERGGPERGGGRWRHCCATEEGDRARATLVRAADRRDRATTGPVGSGWVSEGGGGRGVARRGALTGGPSSTVPAGRVLNPIQTESNYSKRFIRIQNCPNFGRLRKVPSHASKIRNKIWLERA